MQRSTADKSRDALFRLSKLSLFCELHGEELCQHGLAATEENQDECREGEGQPFYRAFKDGVLLADIGRRLKQIEVDLRGEINV